MHDTEHIWDQLDALAAHLQKSYEALLSEVITSLLIYADETYWYLLDKRARHQVVRVEALRADGIEPRPLAGCRGDLLVRRQKHDSTSQ